MTEEELPVLRVAISVLGPDRPFVSPAAFRPGVDGVIVECGRYGALLLPEVATTFGWDALGMLGAVCRKAGLPEDAWARAGDPPRHLRDRPVHRPGRGRTRFGAPGRRRLNLVVGPGIGAVRIP